MAGDLDAARRSYLSAAEHTLSLPQQRYLHGRAARLRSHGRRVQAMSEADAERIGERSRSAARGTGRRQRRSGGPGRGDPGRLRSAHRSTRADPGRVNPDPRLMSEVVPAEFEVLDDRFAGTGGDRWMERVFADGRWLEGPAYSRPAGSSSSATSPTTGCSATTRSAVGWTSSPSRPGSPTAAPSIGRAGSSPASTGRGG